MENLALVQKIFRNRRVLLTGHTGFKGSWMTVLLKILGAEICGYSLPPEEQSHFTELDFKGLNYFENILNSDSLKAAFDKFKPEIVFHMAAQPLVRLSYQDPVETYETNVIGSLKVYQAARFSPDCKCLISITTDKVYENKETSNPYSENDILGGHDPYSSSKACMEIMSRSYRLSFLSGSDLRLITVRAGNIIGGGDWAVDRIIPDLVRGVSAQRPALIRSPFSIRPWQHVLEPLWGYLVLAAQAYSGKNVAEAYNFGPDPKESFSVLDVCKEMQSQWPQLKFEVNETTRTVHEAKTLKLDSSLAKQSLNWHPVLSFSEACQWTSEWYEAYVNNQRILTSIQVDRFLAKV